MLPIHETVKIDGLKYRIETIETGYLINQEFIIYKNESDQWDCKDKIAWELLRELGKTIDELIWFRASGI